MAGSLAGVDTGFSTSEWCLAVLAAAGIGVSKSGLPGLSLLHVLVFAHLFPGARSTGVVLPMLIAGDIGAVLLFRRHAEWRHVRRTFPPAMFGVVAGWWIMSLLPGGDFRRVIGAVVLVLAVLQLLRHWKPGAFETLPDAAGFAWSMGFVAGVVTMLANAAGPVMGLYLLSVGMPKESFVGTSAWFFLLLNLAKVPFSAQLGLIDPGSLLFDAVMVPAIVAGLFLGRAVVAGLPQRAFDTFVVLFALLAAARLLSG
jgi:uncharacterized membrane protein YfcA